MQNLGKKATDKITGFNGIITGKAIYLYGCSQYCLVSKVNKEGKNVISWFDEGRIIITGEGVKAKEVTAKKPGAEFNEFAPKNIH